MRITVRSMPVKRFSLMGLALLRSAAQRSMQKDHDQRSWSQWNDDAALTAEAEGRLARRVHGWEQTRTEVLGRYAITLLPSGPPRQLQSAARVSEERVISNDRSTST